MVFLYFNAVNSLFQLRWSTKVEVYFWQIIGAARANAAELIAGGSKIANDYLVYVHN